MFLEILGWIFLIVIAVVAFFGWKIFRFYKRHANSDLSVAMSVLPAHDMELEPSNIEEWRERERLKFSESELKKIGAKHLGYFCVYNGYAIIRLSMWNFKNKATAVIYEACSTLDEENVTYIIDVVSRVEDGSVCLTTNPTVSYTERPKNHIAVYSETNSVIELLRAIKSAVPEGKILKKTTEPLDFFIECYQDTTVYAWKKEQLESNQTQQTLASVGVKITDELMEELVEIGITHSVEVHVDRARKKLAKHSKMNAEKWEKIREKIIIVNEEMNVDYIMDAVYQAIGEPTALQEKALEGFQITTEKMTDPIAAFQMLAQSLNLSVKRLVKFDEPIRTEIYLPIS